MARRSATEATILPIGHYLGAFHPGLAEPLEHHVLRIGSAPLALASDDELGIWALAHGLPQQADQLWTRRDVLELAEKSEIVDPAGLIEGLLADDVLVEVVPDSPEAIDFAEDHRVVPLLAGAATPATDGVRAIGLAGHPMVELDGLGFELWRFGHLADSLWDYCEIHAEALRTSGQQAFRAAGPAALGPDGQQILETTPEDLLPHLLSRLRVLLAHSAVYLDEAVAS